MSTNVIQLAMKNDPYVSLYDYKGTASRQSGLGQKVYIAAKEKGIHVIYTDIPEDRQREEYNRVATYPKSFLDEYFGQATVETIPIEPGAGTIITEFQMLFNRIATLENQVAELTQKIETNVTNSNEPTNTNDDLPF